MSKYYIHRTNDEWSSWLYSISISKNHPTSAYAGTKRESNTFKGERVGAILEQERIRFPEFSYESIPAPKGVKGGK